MSFPNIELSELAEIRSGFGFPLEMQGQSVGELPFAKVGDISKVVRSGRFRIGNADHYVNRADLPRLRAASFPPGTIVFAKIGEAIRQNFRAITTAEMLFDNNVMGLIPNTKKIRIDFFYHFLNTLDFYKIANATSVPSIRRSDIAKVRVPLPPLDEQRRIAAVLDKADEVRHKRRQAIEKLDELLQSVFLDMFGNPIKNPKDWKIELFDAVCKTRLGKMLDQKRFTGRDLRLYLRNVNVQWNRFDLSDVDQMDFDEREREVLRLQYGDLLICEGGDVGRAAIWRNELPECYYQKALHRGRPDNERATPEFLMFLMWFLSRNGGFKNYVTSATIAHLTGEKLKSMRIPLPPIHLQRQFSRIVEKHSLTKEKYLSAERRTQNLFHSIQQRAFNGELLREAKEAV